MPYNSIYPPIKQIKSINVLANFGKTSKEFDFTAPRLINTIICLASKGSSGLTALEASSWAYRLGAYIHTLRHDYGMDIQTLKEDHDGGWHARYILHTPITILEINIK